MKKFLMVLVSALSIFAFVFAACSNGSGENTSNDSETSKTETEETSLVGIYKFESMHMVTPDNDVNDFQAGVDGMTEDSITIVINSDGTLILTEGQFSGGGNIKEENGKYIMTLETGAWYNAELKDGKLILTMESNVENLNYSIKITLIKK